MFGPLSAPRYVFNANLSRLGMAKSAKVQGIPHEAGSRQLGATPDHCRHRSMGQNIGGLPYGRMSLVSVW
jgi:hypothetical protein